MLGRRFSDELVRAFNETDIVKTITARAIWHLQSLIEALSEYKYRADLGVEIVLKEPVDRILADIFTPFGLGRVRLDWSNQDTAAVGVLVFERSRYDKFDVPYWEPVWDLQISADGMARTGGDAPIVLSRYVGGSESWALRLDVVRHLSVAIALGPQHQ